MHDIVLRLTYFTIHHVIISTGIGGFLNSEECAIGNLLVHSLDAFNVLSGFYFIIVFFMVSLIFHFMIKHGLGGVRSKVASVLRNLILFLFIVSIIVGFADIMYSSYITSQVYGQFDEFQESQVNCLSYMYYSSFVSVAIVFN